MQQLAHQVLAADDVEQGRDGHQDHAQDHPPHVDIGGAKERQQHGKGDVDQDSHQEYRDRDRQRRPHALLDIVADIPPVIGAAELKRKQPDRLVEENRVGDFLKALRLRVVQQRLVVAPLRLPFPDRLRRHPFHAQVHPCHVIRAVDHEEQGKGQQVDPDQDRDGIQYPACDVGEHDVGLSCSVVCFDSIQVDGAVLWGFLRQPNLSASSTVISPPAVPAAGRQ